MSKAKSTTKSKKPTAPSALTPEAIETLQRDQKRLKAIVRALDLNNIGEPNQPIVYRVNCLIQSYQQQRLATVKLIARKRPGAATVSIAND